MLELSCLYLWLYYHILMLVLNVSMMTWLHIVFISSSFAERKLEAIQKRSSIEQRESEQHLLGDMLVH